MDRATAQARIDAISWYHEFDFGDGLVARSKVPTAPGLRRLVEFLERQLDAVDFRGKSVLDIGCWDGYWSFSAERRGAGRVLATDDRTQNWAKETGVVLAKELLGSSVEVNRDVPIYDLAGLGRKFDVILCLGVYYHLYDPFYAFAQVRHCCHPNTLVLIDGPEGIGLPPATSLYQYTQRRCEWLPSPGALDQILQATYLSVQGRATQEAPPAAAPPPSSPPPPPAPPTPQVRLGWRWRLRMCAQALLGSRPGVRELYHKIEAPPAPPPPAAAPAAPAPPPVTAHRRALITCVPLEGANPIYDYRPPFGLHQYDPRFRDGAARRAA